MNCPPGAKHVASVAAGILFASANLNFFFVDFPATYHHRESPHFACISVKSDFFALRASLRSG
jgi:hypothetical protein